MSNATQLVTNLKKSLIGESTTLATAGALQPEQADRFIDYVTDESQMHAAGVRIERFDPSSMYIDKLNTDQWVVFPKAEAQDPRTRSGVEASRIQVAPKDLVVLWEVSDQFLRRNLEKEGGEAHIMRMLAARAANNIETCELHGDTLGPAMTENEYYGTDNTSQYVKNQTMAQFDGWMKLARSGHVVDAEGAPITPDLIMECQERMPTKFQARPNQLFLPVNLNHRYNRRVASRGTPSGDAALAGANGPSWGIQRVPTPLLQFQPLTVEHLTLTGTDTIPMLYTNVSSVVVTPNSLSKTPTTPYVADTDYTLDAAAGTITRIGGGAISAGQTVKVTYKASPQMLFTVPSNLILALGREMKFVTEYKGAEDMWLFAMHMSVAVQIEETDASVLCVNMEA